MKTNGQTELIMKHLHIKRQESYEENPGKYKCTIQYTTKSSDHTLTLDETISERVLAFIGPVICEAAAMVAEETKINIQRSVEALNNRQARTIEAGDLVNAGVSQTAPPNFEPAPAPGSPAEELELREEIHKQREREAARENPEAYKVPLQPGDVF